jgi:hypothetical protein
MKTTIKIMGVEVKESQAGKEYWSVSTDKGSMTCFEQDIAKKLISNAGNTIVVEMVEKNNFKNIRGISEEGAIEVLKVTHDTIKETKDQFAKAREEKNKSIYASYAKDLIIGGMSELDAIETVKRLLGAF